MLYSKSVTPKMGLPMGSLIIIRPATLIPMYCNVSLAINRVIASQQTKCPHCIKYLRVPKTVVESHFTAVGLMIPVLQWRMWKLGSSTDASKPDAANVRFVPVFSSTLRLIRSDDCCGSVGLGSHPQRLHSLSCCTNHSPVTDSP